MKYFLFLGLVFVSLLFLIPSISALEDEQLVFCDSFNSSWTYINCINFWNNISSILTNVSCPVLENVTCENVTITELVNQTIYVDKNCSDEFQWFKYELDHTLEMEKIKNGTCVACDITKEECEKQKLEIASLKSSSSNTSNSSNNPKDDDKTFTYILYGLGGLVAFFLYKKFKPNLQNISQMPQAPIDYGQNQKGLVNTPMKDPVPKTMEVPDGNKASDSESSF